MEKELNKIILNKIAELTPSNVKPVYYLMEILDIEKDSAYKRLKGDVPFSFKDITILSKKMGFSLDEIVNSNNLSRVIYSVPFHPQKTFLEILQDYLLYLTNLSKAEYAETIIALNRVHVLFSIGHAHLFRFLYYKWIHQTNRVPSYTPYANVVVPDDILEIYSKVRYYYQKMNNTTLIMDQEVFLSIIREIQYYYRRELILEDELNVLKNDFMSYLDYFEQVSQKGMNDLGNTTFIYISNLNLQSSVAYTKYDMIERSDYWLSALSSISTFDRRACELNKKWLQSLKRYSFLITKSNDMLQAKFIDQQRRYVENIDNSLYLMKLL